MVLYEKALEIRKKVKNIFKFIRFSMKITMMLPAVITLWQLFIEIRENMPKQWFYMKKL